MALPVRIQQRGQRGQRGGAMDPMDIVRQDLSVLGRLFGGRGLFDTDDDVDALASIGSYGVDIREDQDHVYVEVDLPGFRKDDVDISLENGTLTIVAERREEIADPPPGAQGQQAQPG